MLAELSIGAGTTCLFGLHKNPKQPLNQKHGKFLLQGTALNVFQLLLKLTDAVEWVFCKISHQLVAVSLQEHRN